MESVAGPDGSPVHAVRLRGQRRRRTREDANYFEMDDVLRQRDAGDATAGDVVVPRAAAMAPAWRGAGAAEVQRRTMVCLCETV